jgi:hypothetical protein
MVTSADELGMQGMLSDKYAKLNFVRAFQHPANQPPEALCVAAYVAGAIIALMLIHKYFKPVIARG